MMVWFGRGSLTCSAGGGMGFIGLRKGKIGTHDPPGLFIEALRGVHPRGGGGMGTQDPWNIG